jgi:hypothetical protein
VKLIRLSASASPSPVLARSGVCGAGKVLPRGRVGVVLGLHVVLLRKLNDFAVRLASEGVGVVSFVLCNVVAFVAVINVSELEEGLVLLGEGLTWSNDGSTVLGDGLEYPALLVLPTIRMVVDGTRVREDGSSVDATEETREDVVEVCLCGGLPSASDLEAIQGLTTVTCLKISKS